VLGLKWEHVDWDNHCLNLPESKTGARTIHLSPPALEVLHGLQNRRKKESPWVLPGRAKGGALVGLPHAWLRIRKRAKLGDLRLHDLRHSFASVAAANNMSLPMIGALLGHTQPQTTQRYAHLAADPLKEATERIGERIVAMMNGKRRRSTVTTLDQKQRSRRPPRATLA
jgi:integrase